MLELVKYRNFEGVGREGNPVAVSNPGVEGLQKGAGRKRHLHGRCHAEDGKE